jgi:ATP-GRASP peptide maturase of grasp-with-spasm system
MKNKFILICSDLSESSTDTVCSWLSYYNKNFLRISNENVITIKEVIIKNNYLDIIFNIDEIEYKLSNIKSYWYRRSRLKFAKINQVKYQYEAIDLSNEVNSFLQEEYNKVIEFFEYKLNELSVLNKFNDNYINKLNVLALAQKLGIKTPETRVLNDFTKLKFDKNKYITKAISDLTIKKNNRFFYCMTQRIDFRDGEDLFYSLVQKEVKKKFEIRSFFFNNKFFSSAIFSQENDKTSLDFRNYDDENPNRVVPFKLPQNIEDKLLKLCKTIDLKSGSFDLAYTNENDYILFEVNPVGQFEQVSFPCNYNIHKEIALRL